MDKTELEHWIAKGESEQLEFKASWNGLEDACKSLCGFLNGRGGKVLLGVRNDHKIVGVTYNDHDQQKLAQHFKKFDPAAPLHIETVAIETDLFVVVIAAQPVYESKLYQYDGRVYERVGSTRQIMPIAKQQRLLLEYMERGGYEQLPAYGSLSDLDQELIQTVVKHGIATGRITSDAQQEPLLDVLQKRFGLMQGEQLLNGALILFGKHFGHYPQCTLKMIAYRGVTEEDNQILDNVHLSANLFKSLTEAQAFVSRFTSIKTTFPVDQFRRVDKPQVPPLALREILVNALIHRNYSARDGFISIKVFSDRLEVWNIGLLNSELSLDALKHAHLSKLRNSNIAKVFYYDNLVENWGKGTQRVLSLCRDNDMPEPEFLECDGGFKVTVYFEPVLQPEFAETPVEAVVEYEEAPASLVQAITKLFEHQPQLTLDQILTQLETKAADRTVRRYLRELEAEGLLALKGRGRHAVWIWQGLK